MDRRAGLILRQVNQINPVAWDRVVPHPLQTWEWGEFRKKTGLRVIRLGVFNGKKLVQGFQMTLHKIPHTPFTIGYLAKCALPSQKVLSELAKIGKAYNCIYIQIEPHAEKNMKPSENLKLKIENLVLRPSLSTTFAQNNFVVDVTKPEEELITNMHPKTRYNIRIAQRHGVKVEEYTDEKGFQIFLKLYFETAKRQHYFGHTPKYHRLLWETLQPAGIARVLIAYYTPESPSAGVTQNPIPLTAWMIFKLNDTLYYPYGGSTDKYRNVMASNLVAWEAIRLAKKLKTKYLDLWGSLGENADPNHPWYGFHRFKQGFGGKPITYIDSQDLILNQPMYWLFQLANKTRWIFLRLFPH